MMLYPCKSELVKSWKQLAVAGFAIGVMSFPLLADVPRGTVAAAIRSSDHSCARVIEMKEVMAKKDGTRVLEVQCNSGRFKVTYKGDKLIDVKPV